MSNKPKNILFRADSSSTIGTGHIMRDLVLAEQFDNAKIIFATQELSGNINYKIKENDYTIEILSSNDIEEVNNLIHKHSIDMIVIDHYGIDNTYEKQLKVQCPTLIILSLDDTYEKHFCDVLLNHNIYADSSRYKNLVPEYCELRCGNEFTLIREEFKQIINFPSKKDEFFTVLIAMGGSDHKNLNKQVIELLLSYPMIDIHVITTRANANVKDLQKFCRDKTNVHLHINSDKLAPIMYSSNLAVVAPGVILHEIIFLNIPFIAIKTAENQKEMYKYLKPTGSILEEFDASILRKKLAIYLNKKGFNEKI